MSRVFVSNIPEKFQVNDFRMLLEQANIPCQANDQLKIMKSKRHVNNGQSTGRFIILTFDSENLANAAIDAINMMVLTVDKQTTTIRATPFIPNFRQYLENPKSNIVIYNLPAEISSGDLKDLFAEYGTILSAATSGPKSDNSGETNQMGYVLFEKEEDAKRAIEEANNKFLGPNQITVVLYKNIKQRIKENADVRVRALPRDWTPEQVEEYFSNEPEMKKE